MAEFQEQEITEIKNENFDLVKGDFTPSDASEVVTDLFDKKINFHKVKHFSQHIRFNAKDHNSKDRIMELNLAKEEAIELMAEASKSGKSIRLNCAISIELI